MERGFRGQELLGADVVVILNTAGEQSDTMIARATSDGELFEWRRYDTISLEELMLRDYNAEHCKQLAKIVKYAQQQHLQQGRRVALVSNLGQVHTGCPMYLRLRLRDQQQPTKRNTREQCLRLLGDVRPDMLEKLLRFDSRCDLQSTVDATATDKRFREEWRR